MSAEKICTLSVDHTIRIAKIITTAPVERLPMITQPFHQASVDLEGLEELIENTALSTQGSLIDTGEFLAELTAGRELTEKGYSSFFRRNPNSCTFCRICSWRTPVVS